MEATATQGWPRAFDAWYRWAQEAAEDLCSHAEDQARYHKYGRPRGPRWQGKGAWGFGGPPLNWSWGGPPRPRSRRGDIRLAVLTLLAEQPMHGYQIITELTERSGGMWRPSPGSVYPALQQLEDEGLVSVSEREGRRTYVLTDAGRAESERLSQGRRAPWEEMAEEAEGNAGGLSGTAAQVFAAAMQVSVVGSPEQIDQAEALLTDTRRALYRILAEDDEAEEEEE